jgi:AcrR family transcriptional regulator
MSDEDADRADAAAGRRPKWGISSRSTPVKSAPPTTKGRRTREALIRGARRAFERDGFLNARVTDMTRSATVSQGSFYSYFDSKEDIFWEVLDEVTDDIFASHSGRRDDAPRDRAPGDIAAAVAEANSEFVESFRRNAAMIRVLEEVATYNDEFRRYRREVRHKFIERVERNLRRQQIAGIVGPDVDTPYAAHLLGAMIDRFCYAWFVLEEDFQADRAMAELNRLWMAAVGIRDPARPSTEPSDT